MIPNYVMTASGRSALTPLVKAANAIGGDEVIRNTRGLRAGWSAGEVFGSDGPLTCGFAVIAVALARCVCFVAGCGVGALILVRAVFGDNSGDCRLADIVEPCHLGP
jgi:hypothetical protein